jgi:hypothetical protein
MIGKMRTAVLVGIFTLAIGNTAFAFCFEEAGAQYGINPQILRAIAKVESNFNPAAINKNSNGTYDVGLMQINSIWASTIGKERWKQLGDACTNTKTGAWILSMCMNKYGYNWKAIGCYNSQTPEKRDRYARMVFNQLQRVKPLDQEANYTPLKDKVEDLVKSQVENWVDDAAQGKGDEFTLKVPAKGAAKVAAKSEPAKQAEEPPTLAGSPMQFASPDPAQASQAADAAAVDSSQTHTNEAVVGVMP